MLFSVIMEKPAIDLGSFYHVTTSMEAAAMAYAQVDSIGLSMGFIPESLRQNIQYFTWDGIQWTTEMFLPRLIWVGLALTLVIVAALVFKRFDPSNVRIKQKKSTGKVAAKLYAEQMKASVSTLSINAIEKVRLSFNYIRMLRAEMHLSLKSQHWAWHSIALILFILQLVIPFEYVRAYVLPIAWVLPLVIWGNIGTRDKNFNTRQIMMSSPYPLKRQLVVAWLSGVLITIMMGAGALVRSLLLGQFDYSLSLCVGAVFISTLALMLGAMTGSKKFFEILYLALWYVGPLNQLTALDFLGTSAATISSGSPLTFLIVTLLMIPASAILWRMGRFQFR